MQVRLLPPAAAPVGTTRLRPILDTSLQDTNFDRARFAVAFAKKGGVARLLPSVALLRKRGGRIHVIVGIDSHGTTAEALDLLLTSMDSTFVTFEPNPGCSFHPKMYLFDGPGAAQAIIGSHNMTVGGLELNYESAVVLDFRLPQEQAEWRAFEDAWTALLPPQHRNTVPLDGPLIQMLVNQGLVLPERVAQARGPRPGKGTPATAPGAKLPFGGMGVAPPSALPLPHAPQHRRIAAVANRRQAGVPSPVEQGNTLLIEVVPHHNAEVFLSKRALDQNPGFFGWPWAGRTNPKDTKNPGYPKRDPNPRIKVRAFDKFDNLVYEDIIAPLVVLYERKSEVRVTVGKAVMQYIPAYALLVLRNVEAGLEERLDYDMDVYLDGSPTHSKLTAICNQTLPSGGTTRPRRMGWL